MVNLSKTILYIGTDVNYWNSVQRTFETTYEHVSFEFVSKPPFSENDINQVLLDIIELDPDFIYLDLCKNEKPLISLGQFISRIMAFRHTPTIGLVDKLEKTKEMLGYGIDFVYVKGAEIHDVVYHPYFYRFPKEALKKDFALARFKKEATITEHLRVGYYAEDYMHFECTSQFSVGDVIKIDSNIPKEHVLSQLYTVRNVSKRDLYYNTRYSYDVEYKVLPDFKIDQSELEQAMLVEDTKEQEKAVARAKASMSQKQAEYDDRLKKMKKSLKDWVVYNTDDSKAKKTKVLIVEEQLKFLEHDNRKLDSFDFMIRVQTGFDERFSQLEKDLPHILVYSIPDLETGDHEFDEDELKELQTHHEQQTSDFFRDLIEKIGTIENYAPFIIIFNSTQFTSKAFQDTFKYNLILTNSGKLSFDIIAQMAELYEKKQQEKIDKSINDKILELRKKDPKKYGKLNKSDFVEPRYYVSKTSDLSRCEYNHKVELRAISESEIYFSTEKILTLDNYTLKEPFNMTIRLVPQDDRPFMKEGKSLIYKALIHAIGEQEKKELRQFVNEIFTSHKKDAEEKDLENFKKLNESMASKDEEQASEDKPEENS